MLLQSIVTISKFCLPLVLSAKKNQSNKALETNGYFKHYPFLSTTFIMFVLPLSSISLETSSPLQATPQKMQPMLPGPFSHKAVLTITELEFYPPSPVLTCYMPNSSCFASSGLHTADLVSNLYLYGSCLVILTVGSGEVVLPSLISQFFHLYNR